MSNIINEMQKQEIANIANDGHAEALIAYGADLHFQGICKGMIMTIAVVIAGYSVSKLSRKITDMKTNLKG